MTRKGRIVAASAAAIAVVIVLVSGGVLIATPSPTPGRVPNYLVNDSHVHLTNYIQEGANIHDMLNVMGDRVGRAVLFGIPLQQTWSYRISQDDAPKYYLDSDAPLYYYSFTDAHIANAYRSLTKAQQARFDPMITGFNPADMYAADHVRRVLEEYPGVFEGIGEFSIHKEFVTSKIAGETPAIDDRAVDRLFDFAGEVGLVTLLHCDADTPFPKPGEPPTYFKDLKELFARHPGTTIVWAHIGLGRVVRPIKDHAKYVVEMLDDPKLKHLYIDLSWIETAKYILSSEETIKLVADVITRHPDRFLFGTDEVAPTNPNDYLAIYRMYQPLWQLLPPEVSEKVRKGNYERLFDAARIKVRAWEQQHRQHAVILGPASHVQ